MNGDAPTRKPADSQTRKLADSQTRTLADSQTRPLFDARAWAAWLVVAAVMTMTGRNPLYSLVLLLVAVVVGEACAVPGAGLRLPLARIGVVILTFTTLFNAFSVHVGETVLLRLPAGWPWIGGGITLEAAVYGAGNGLLLLALLALFTAFNRIVPTGELVRLTPPALRDLGVVVLIAVTYAPETMRQLQRIREAQAIRGHRLRGLRDWRPIVIPLLIGGLERAMNLAEAMASRGYGATAGVRQPLSAQIMLVTGLTAALAGWLLTFWVGWPGWLLLASGAVLIISLVWRLGRATSRTRYRPALWTKWDTWLLVTAVVPLLLVFIPLPFVDRATLTYSPYPSLTWPRFDPILGLALVGLAFPAASGLFINTDKKDHG